MPFKDKEKQKEYLKKYRQQNKEKIKSYYSDNKEQKDIQTNKYRENNPWLRFYVNAKQRCTNPKTYSYKWYGAKGIKFKLTLEEVKTLWFRDKASNMKRPSIDRKDSDLDYTYENCRFVELSLNSSRKVDSH